MYMTTQHYCEYCQRCAQISVAALGLAGRVSPGPLLAQTKGNLHLKIVGVVGRQYMYV